MDKQKELHRTFLDRLCNAVEPVLRMNRNDRGFKRELARALGMKNPSTVQRWFESSIPATEHLLGLHKKFNISPNTLLGIESGAEHNKPLDLHKIEFIMAADSTTNLPKQFLDPAKYCIGPILRDSESVCFPNNIDNEDIESWGITRKDIVLQRDNIFGVRVPERIGMSMWPIIKPGDLMVIDHSDKELRDGAIFALCLKGNKFSVRQIKKIKDNLILIPWFLKQYPVEMINLNDHPRCVIGRVIISVTYLTALGSGQLPSDQ